MRASLVDKQAAMRSRMYVRRQSPKPLKDSAENARERKLALVELMGGCCKRCKFKGPQCVYHFHHKDNKTKIFAIATRLACGSWQSILDEAKKCELLCANCHAIIHSCNEMDAE